MRLAEDLFLLFKSVVRGAFPPFFNIIAQNIPYHSNKLFVIRTKPSLVHYRDLAKPLSACSSIKMKKMLEAMRWCSGSACIVDDGSIL